METAEAAVVDAPEEKSKEEAAEEHVETKSKVVLVSGAKLLFLFGFVTRSARASLRKKTVCPLKRGRG